MYSEILEIGDKPDRAVLYLWDDLILMIRKCPEIMTQGIMLDTFSINLETNSLISNDHGKSWVKCRSVLWPSYSPRQRQDNEVMAYVLMEPTYIYRRAVRRNMQMDHGKFLTNHVNEDYIIECFRYIYNHHPEPDMAYKLIFSALVSPKFNYDYRSSSGLDKRTEILMRKIKDTVGMSYSIKDYGAMVNLSESRIEHLFRNETTMPISHYRQLCRLRVAAAYVEKFNSISTAAIDAGFSDLAHHSKTFKQVTGMTPSSVYGSSQQRMKIIVSKDLSVPF